MTSLDVDAVRVFLAVGDHQSFTRAADARTQRALRAIASAFTPGAAA